MDRIRNVKKCASIKIYIDSVKEFGMLRESHERRKNIHKPLKIKDYYELIEIIHNNIKHYIPSNKG